MVDNSDDDNHDFTSIADRTAFIHSDDLEAELKFKQLNPANNKKDIETLSEVSHQQEDDLPPDLPPELSFDSEELPNEELIPEVDTEITGRTIRIRRTDLC